MTLAEFLAAKNAEKLAWVAEDPDNRLAGLLTEDLTHWAEIGIHTVEQYRRYDLETFIWEMYKDVTGIRPRHMDFASMSMEQLEQEADYLMREHKRQVEEDYGWETLSAEYAYQDALEEDMERAERPEPIDYIACHHQDGWL